MVEDDTFTYHVKQQSADQINKAAESLITKERTQKLDLLIHLLSNLTQALVVCGPEGIGKTTLLKVLQERKTESWRYCLIQGNAALSFEVVQEYLVKSQLGKPVQSLSAAPGHPTASYKQVILIIDNAGELVPGLIAAIIQYAAANPILRAVFALTHDELQVKRGSDRAIDDCHIIEIPSLSEKQCGDFLQQLSTKPYANLSFKAIGDNMIAHIYRETHGVPGRIIAEVSGLSSSAKPGGKLKWIFVLAIALAIAIALGVQWLMPSSLIAPSTVPPPTSVEQKKTDNSEMTPSRTESQIKLAMPPAQPIIQPQPVPANEGGKAKDAVEPPVGVNANSKNEQQTVAPMAMPEAASTAVGKPLASEALPSSAIAPVPNQAVAHFIQLEVEREKPKQPALLKKINAVEPPSPQSSEIKAKAEPAAPVGAGKKQDKKQLDIVQQKTAEQLWAAQEKLKQAELNKTVDSVEPVTSHRLETILIPEKPVDIAAVPEEQGIKTAVPKPIEPEKSWAQTADNFTLQLMVLSKQPSASEILKKYPVLGPDIRIIRTIAKGKEKFILEYGSYPDATSANKAKESLPFEFHRALVKKIAQ